jgi:hypothetical protein
MMRQLDLFEPESTRSLLDKLLTDAKLYTRSRDYMELLRFVVRLRNFAPFNAMLLQVQKPGLRYAASAEDWDKRFGRWPKEGARPLLILWPFGPVALVYDLIDTEGHALPEDVAAFYAHGDIGPLGVATFRPLLEKKNIEWLEIDAGDGKAGSIQVLQRATSKKESSQYRMIVNRNHGSAVQFATITHELGHLFLGHLGPDKKLNVPGRQEAGHADQELEAESVSYLVCARNGIRSKSETYLTNYVNKHTTVENLDIYQVMRAAGQVETLLGLSASAKFSGLL